MDIEALLRNQTDRLRGLDFLEVVGADQHGFDPDLVHHSAPSGGGDLVRIFKDLDVAPSARLLDIGCGRGSAIRAILKLPFQQVDGLELIPELAAIAKNNFRLLKAHRTSIHLADATTFNGYGEYSHFYMYNPFPAAVMAQCIAKILTARDATEAPTTLIYVNPLCDSTIMATGRFRRTDAGRQVRGKQVLVYRSN